MIKKNQLQFAVVREDPEIESFLFQRFQIKRPILIGSGGCTCLSLSVLFPDIKISLIEPNIHQINLIKSKMKILEIGQQSKIKRHFSIGKLSTNKVSYIECGNFESLFRQFRLFIWEFVVDENEMTILLQKRSAKSWRAVFKNPYWFVAFELFFSDSILKAMFGPIAIQHAPTGSYPKHFRQVIERGLLSNDGNNYFLHHIFLGYYVDKKSALPIYLQKRPKSVNVQFLNSMAEDIRSYKDYDFVGLSNIFDWSSENQIKVLSNKLKRDLKSGSVLLFRQLNNKKSFIRFFEGDFVWSPFLEKKLLSNDRSLFYSSLHIGVKV